MSRILMVPIHVDALFLDFDQSVVEAMADFSRLPYFNGERDVNPDVANISELILSQPLEDANLHLKAGIHLHWALPDALTKGVHNTKKGVTFPAVLNRWLVTRTINEKISLQWVIESDYLYSPGEQIQPGAIAYPYKDKTSPQPYRFMGRKLPLEAWKNRDKSPSNPNQYLDKLTAIGYGEPSFAAFYPNCHSVFGFYDDLADIFGDQGGFSIEELQGVRYDVIGWYSDSQNDYLRSETLLDAIRDNVRKYSLDSPTTQIKYQALEEEFSWTVKEEEKDEDFPDLMLCYSQLEFQATEFSDSRSDGQEKQVPIAIGNTGTEALSAYLANTASGDKAKVEDQLEALHLAPHLQSRQLDLGMKFKEARHEKEFTAVPAGTIWTIRPETAASTSANSENAVPQAQVTLPYKLAHLLNRLNLRQQAYDRDCFEIESQRKQLFADWYKYMIRAYPPTDDRDGYPNVDEVKYFIEKNDLFPLKQREAQNDALESLLQQSINDLYKSVSEVQLLTVTDIEDWPTLRAAFQARDRPAAIKHILSLLSQLNDNAAQQSRKLLTQSDPIREEDWDQVVKGINMILMRPDFYDEKAFGLLKNDFTAELSALLQPPRKEITQWPYHRVLRFNRLLLEASLPEVIKKSVSYTLKQVPAPRFWRPNDPVVLVADVKPTPRHGEDGHLHPDGLLVCQSLSLDKGSIEENLQTIRKEIDKLTPDEKGFGFRTWTEQPWHPFLLEWKVEISPLRGSDVTAKRDKNNLDPQSRDYSADFITANYQLPEDAVDLSIRPDKRSLGRAANVYHGRSILTPHAKQQLIDQIETFLENRLLRDYYEAKKVETSERTNDYFIQHKDEILAWYRNQTGKSKNAVTDQILAIYEQIAVDKNGAESKFHILAQSLTGFNEALLMHKQTLQLPIDDPLGFEDYREFTNAVREAVGKSSRSAPQPQNDFNPIRTGSITSLELRLVDTFGRVEKLTPKNGELITTEVMTDPQNPHMATLPPRITQPTRINFRWLAANREIAEGADEPEMNAHPATTPVCGWFLPNNLDNSLMVYDAQGRALGSIRREGWTPAPGYQPIAAGQIRNPHLHKLVQYILQQDEAFLTDFLTAIESALENIDPEDFAHHEGLALLIGRPIAIVRASLNLELQGLPAIHQGWNEFRKDLARNGKQRDSDNFTSVEFPIRVGEYRQLNDGLVGYWVEEGDGYKDNRFYAPQTAGIDHPNIIIHRENQPLNILQSLAAPAHKLTMLVDPRGPVHATSGILPTKAIRIPSDQFAEALRAMEVTFLTTPILTDRGKINLPLPAEPGYAWSWLEREKDGTWDETPDIGSVSTQATFASRQELREGWLKLNKVNEE